MKPPRASSVDCSPVPEHLLWQLDWKLLGGRVPTTVLRGVVGRGTAGEAGSPEGPGQASHTHAHFHVVRASVILFVQQLKVVLPGGCEPGDTRSQGMCPPHTRDPKQMWSPEGIRSGPSKETLWPGQHRFSGSVYGLCSPQTYKDTQLCAHMDTLVHIWIILMHTPTYRLGLDTWELNLVNSPGAVHSKPVWGATQKGSGGSPSP